MKAKGRLIAVVVHQEEGVANAHRTAQRWRQDGVSARVHQRTIKVDGLKVACSIVVVRATDEMEEQS